MTTAQFALRRTDPQAGGLLPARLRQYRRRLWLGRIVRNSLALGYWSAVVAVAAAGVLVFFPAVETLEPDTHAGVGLRIRPAGRSGWVGSSGRGWWRGPGYTREGPSSENGQP